MFSRMALILATLTALNLAGCEKEDSICLEPCQRLVQCGDEPDPDACLDECEEFIADIGDAGVNTSTIPNCIFSNYVCGEGLDGLGEAIFKCMANACKKTGECSEDDPPSCCADSIVQCSEGTWYGGLCEWVCDAGGGTYVGPGGCGSEYQGQQSSTGDDVCWCK